MENIIVDGNTVSLSTLRKGVAEAVKRAYGAERSYAVALNALFPFEWFEIEASDTSENGKAVKAEKTLLYTELKAAEHTNPSTVWARRPRCTGPSTPPQLWRAAWSQAARRRRVQLDGCAVWWCGCCCCVHGAHRRALGVCVR